MGENPRFWVAFGIGLATLALCLVMLTYQSTSAHAQAACAPYKELQKALLDKFHETPTSAGLAEGDKQAITIFTSPNGATWTLVIVDTKGMACLMSVGKNWSDLAEAKGEPS